LWKTTHDPIQLLADWLQGTCDIHQDLLENIEREVQREIAAGVEFAEAAPLPEASEVNEDVYA